MSILDTVFVGYGVACRLLWIDDFKNSLQTHTLSEKYNSIALTISQDMSLYGKKIEKFQQW